MKNLVLVAAAAATLSYGPAFAAQTISPTTRAFLANVTPNVDFLDRASRIALANSKDARLKAVARGEAYDNTLAANALYAWTQATSEPTVPGPLLTGRSVATSAPQDKAEPVDERSPRGQEDLDFVSGLEGPEFDQAYRERIADALEQVASDYRAYLDKGDDPALKAIAANELPKAERAIADLART